MKTLYIQCNMGAAGDMLMGALLDAYGNKEEFVREMNSLKIPGVEIFVEQVEKCGITGSHVHVKINGIEEESCDHHHEEHEHHHEGDNHVHSHEHDHHHHHHGMAEIIKLIDSLPVSEKVREDGKAVYEIIASAESKVHGKPMDEIHFHEVGTMDAVADVIGNCILMEKIGAEKIVVSPIHVGSGQVKCAHGVLPVPAPATALILEGLPIYSGNVKGELCTPTGAALLKYFGEEYGKMPEMTVNKIGYGMGNKDFDEANCVRVFIGERKEEKGEVAQLSCNIDDMSGEDISYAMEVLFQEGALDVFTSPIGMKKSRPAVMLTCLCNTEEGEKFASLMLKHTSSIGVREEICKRYTLNREEEEMETRFGKVRVKHCTGHGVDRRKVESDDLRRLARENNLSIEEIKREIGVNEGANKK